LDFADVNMEQLVTRVAEAYRIQSPDHAIEVDFPKPLPLVWGDEERLRQVLTNLVGNAIKYSPKGGAIRIGAWAEPMDGTEPVSVVTYVADEGIGIPKDELPQIFERFYRVDSTFRRSTAGAGLGLFLSKAIIDAHGGEIWARSEPGAGATFFFSLPASQHLNAENSDF
jgi:signal transduction histidine kinase